MKASYSKNWKRSVQPRKQRKYRVNAPLHVKCKMMSAHLSAELRSVHKKRSISLRKNDLVKIMKGKFKGTTGKVMSVNTKKYTAQVENASTSRKDGTKLFVPINASNLMIVELDTQDNARLNSDG